MAIRLRRALTWKSWFYRVGLPLLARSGPERSDRILALAGQGLIACRPGLRHDLRAGLRRVGDLLGADWDEATTLRDLAANLARTAARDFLLAGRTSPEILARFDGEEEARRHLDSALALGRGTIVVGSHLGAHLPALAWLDRQAAPLRLLVQRPRHISPTLADLFDREGPHPQAGFTLRRALTPTEGTQRLLAARAALREGMIIYLGGDILWPGPNCRPGRFLGFERTFLGVWADLAALAGAPVVFLSATHQTGGRYRLLVDPPQLIQAGAEGRSVADFLNRLEGAIRAHPADALPYLLWPCFGPPAESVAAADPRIGRRVAVAVGS